MSLNCQEGQLSVDTRLKLSNSTKSEAWDQFPKREPFRSRLDNSVMDDLD